MVRVLQTWPVSRPQRVGHRLAPAVGRGADSPEPPTFGELPIQTGIQRGRSQEVDPRAADTVIESEYRAVFHWSRPTAGMEVGTVPGLPEVEEGDDLVAMVSERVDLRGVDLICVASTIVSKAEGRMADLADFEPGDRARDIATRLEAVTSEEKDPRFAQAVIEESEELLIDLPFLLSVTHFGHITVNAGIDRSNVLGGDLLLLPADPAASAHRLHRGLGVPVIVTDTSGRPFRHGQRGVAIGFAGMPASRDWRGEPDRQGRELTVTVQSVVDELAGAANLVTGEGDGGTPVATVRDWRFGDHAGQDELFRSPEDDLVRQALREWTYGGGP